MSTLLKPFSILSRRMGGVVLLKVALFGHLLAQQYDPNDWTIKDQILPSPTAAALGSYGETPVDLHRGTPQLSIPLWTATEGSLEVPILLSYRASGIKVEETASWVGLGWSLQAGGIITCAIKDVPDLWAYKGAQRLLLSEGDAASLESIVINLFNRSTTDTEPDIFSFNFNGYSGTFYFDAAGNPIVVSDDNLEVYWEEDTVNTNQNGRFRILDGQGITYHFSAGEMTFTNRLSQTAWYLTKIESHTGYSITFEYTPEVFHTHALSNAYKLIHLYANFERQENDYFTRKRYDALRLAKIESGSGSWSIDFIPSPQSRQDISDGNSFALEKIRVLEKDQTLIREFVFDTDYFIATGRFSAQQIVQPGLLSTYEYTNYRLKLQGITERGVFGANERDHTFEYYGENASDYRDMLPSRLSAAQDHWGYYNGANNENLIPTYFVAGADRNPSDRSIVAGTLQSITYPTGLTTVLEFENNHFSKPVSSPGGSGDPGNAGCSGSLQMSFPPGGETHEQTCTLGTTTNFVTRVIFEIEKDDVSFADLEDIQFSLRKKSSGIEIFSVRGQVRNLNNPRPDEPVFDFIVTDPRSGSSGGFTFWGRDLPGGGSDGGTESFYVDGDRIDLEYELYSFFYHIALDIHIPPAGSGEYIASLTGNPASSDTETFTGLVTFQDIPDDAGVGWPSPSSPPLVFVPDFGPGLRIKSQKQYADASTNRVLSSKSYVYGTSIRQAPPSYAEIFIEDPEGVLAPWDLSSHHFQDPFYYTNIGLLSNGHFIKVESRPLNNVKSGACYRSVTVHEPDNGSITYEYSSMPDEVGGDYVSVLSGAASQGSQNSRDKPVLGSQYTHYPYQPDLDLSWMRGKLLSTVYRNETGAVVQKILNKYTFVELPRVYGNVINVRHAPVWYNGNTTRYEYLYSGGNYYLQGGWSYLNRQEVIEYDLYGVPTLNKTTVFDHGSLVHKNLTSMKEYNSDEDPLSGSPARVTTYQYVNDLGSSEVKNKMNELNMVDMPVQYETWHEATLLVGKKNNYEVQDGQVLLDNIEIAKSGESGHYYQKRTQVHSYDAHGNPTRISNLGTEGGEGIMTQYVRGYDLRFPVIKAGHVPQELIYEGAVLPAGFTSLDDLLESLKELKTSVEKQRWTNYNENLRMTNPEAHIYTYTYSPLVGMTSETDPNGVTTYYEYDDLGRLTLIRDMDGYIISDYKYNYGN
ncbi:MAG: RHS repeat protein [Cytophagales bacterium]|nr:RHS repeat protein [Cytophagales bacterium]